MLLQRNLLPRKLLPETMYLCNNKKNILSAGSKAEYIVLGKVINGQPKSKI